MAWWRSLYTLPLHLHSPVPPRVMSDFCQSKVDGIRCDCKEFSPSEDKPLACAECSHGRSKHPKLPNQAVGAAGNKSSILKIFQNISSNKPASNDFEQARAETLQGFAAGKLGKSSQKGKASASVIILPRDSGLTLPTGRCETCAGFIYCCNSLWYKCEHLTL